MKRFETACLLLTLGAAGCVSEGVRQVRVEPLGPYRDVHAAHVEATGEAPRALREELARGVSDALASRAQLQPTATERSRFEVELQVLGAEVGEGPGRHGVF